MAPKPDPSNLPCLRPLYSSHPTSSPPLLMHLQSQATVDIHHAALSLLPRPLRLRSTSAGFSLNPLLKVEAWCFRLRQNAPQRNKDLTMLQSPMPVKPTLDFVRRSQLKDLISKYHISG